MMNQNPAFPAFQQNNTTACTAACLITIRQYTIIYLGDFVKCFPSTVCAGPGSSAGRPAPANRSHHPAAADCLSFRKQSPRQYTGQNSNSSITHLIALFWKFAMHFNTVRFSHYISCLFRILLIDICVYFWCVNIRKFDLGLFFFPHL